MPTTLVHPEVFFKQDSSSKNLNEIQQQLEPGTVFSVPATHEHQKYLVFSDVVVDVGAQIAQGETSKVSNGLFYGVEGEPYYGVVKQALRGKGNDLYACEKRYLEQAFGASIPPSLDAPLWTGVDQEGVAYGLYVAQITDVAHFPWNELDKGERPRVLASWIGQLAEVYAQMHERGFVHGDIRPENMLVNEEGSLPTDFETVRSVNAPGLQTRYSSLYADPSAFFDGNNAVTFFAQVNMCFYPSRESDCFAFGRSIEYTLNHLLNAEGSFDVLKGVSGELRKHNAPLSQELCIEYDREAPGRSTYIAPRRASEQPQVFIAAEHDARFKAYLEAIDLFCSNGLESHLLTEILRHAIYQLQNPDVSARSMRASAEFFSLLQAVDQNRI